MWPAFFVHIAERWLWAWQRTAASVNFAHSSCTIKKRIFCSVVCDVGSYSVQHLKISAKRKTLTWFSWQFLILSFWKNIINQDFSPSFTALCCEDCFQKLHNSIDQHRPECEILVFIRWHIYLTIVSLTVFIPKWETKFHWQAWNLKAELDTMKDTAVLLKHFHQDNFLFCSRSNGQRSIKPLEADIFTFDAAHFHCGHQGG